MAGIIEIGMGGQVIIAHPNVVVAPIEALRCHSEDMQAAGAGRLWRERHTLNHPGWIDRHIGIEQINCDGLLTARSIAVAHRRHQLIIKSWRASGPVSQTERKRLCRAVTIINAANTTSRTLGSRAEEGQQGYAWAAIQRNCLTVGLVIILNAGGQVWPNKGQAVAQHARPGSNPHLS